MGQDNVIYLKKPETFTGLNQFVSVLAPFDLKMYRRKAIAWLLIFISFSLVGAAQLRQAPYGSPILSGYLENPSIKEASGMVASHQNQGVFWIHNDGGNDACLFAVTASGRHVGTFQIAAAKNIDWEDLALFYHAQTAYLLIADVGDNDAQRSDCSLYALVEPKISQSDSAKHHTLEIAWQRRFRYEDGPRDCEAVAVDVASRKILLLSKRDEPPVLYSLPLWPATAGKIEIANKIVKISNIPPPTQADLQFKYGQYRSQPTAMDISPSGREIVVLTYKNAYSYKHLAGEDWKTSFSRPPAVVYLPLAEKSQLRQREALCFGADGQTLFVTSEGQFAPIYRVERNNHYSTGY
jgi:hypothetical protein